MKSDKKIQAGDMFLRYSATIDSAGTNRSVILANIWIVCMILAFIMLRIVHARVIASRTGASLRHLNHASMDKAFSNPPVRRLTHS